MVLKVGAMSPQYQPVCGLCEKRKFSGLRQTYESGALEGVPRSMCFNQWPDEFETPCPAAYAREMRPQFQQSGKERFTQQPRIEHLLDATLHQARGVLSLHDASFGNLLWLVRCAGKQWEDRGRGAVAGGEGSRSLSVPGFPGALPGSTSRCEPGRGEDVGARDSKEGLTLWINCPFKITS